jgi:hypothetical protein
MKNIFARVKVAHGNAKNIAGQWGEDEFRQRMLPVPSFLEMVEQHGAIYLLRLDADGEYLTDTWHETIDAAKQQASFEFGISEGDWIEKDEKMRPWP